MSDLLGIWVGAILTLLVFSYLLGDTPLFRIAQAIFVGVAVGYAVNAAFYLILLPRLIYPLADDPRGFAPLFVPLALGILLFAKLRAAWAPLGNLPIAFLFGVGAALAIGGALSGALVPQIAATVVSLAPAQKMETVIGNWLLVIGTIGALLSFRFLAQPQRPLARAVDALGRGWAYVGRWFVLIAFGAIFADTAVARVSVLIDRVYFLLHDWLQIVR
jgi:hypothetical protein